MVDPWTMKEYIFFYNVTVYITALWKHKELYKIYVLQEQSREPNTDFQRTKITRQRNIYPNTLKKYNNNTNNQKKTNNNTQYKNNSKQLGFTYLKKKYSNIAEKDHYAFVSYRIFTDKKRRI